MSKTEIKNIKSYVRLIYLHLIHAIKHKGHCGNYPYLMILICISRIKENIMFALNKKTPFEIPLVIINPKSHSSFDEENK